MGKKIQDPIHGLMEFEDWMVEFIDTEHFQRLRNIKQLGTVYYVYPGACHSRFEHCLGVAHLAHTLVKRIHKTQPELYEDEKNLKEKDLKCVTLAALCHDLGHGPFSHLFESDFIDKIRHESEWTHEKASRMMLEDLVSKNNIDLDKEDERFIMDLIIGRDGSHGTRSPYLFDIVANKRNSIDVDKFDYLARDCYYLGVKSSFDFSRLMNYSKVFNNQIVYNFKESYNIYELFHTRYSLHKKAYNHRVGKAINYMIRDALMEADSVFKISESIDDPNEYLKMDDTIINRIDCHSRGLEKSKAIIKRIRTRDFYKFVDEFLVPNNLREKLNEKEINEFKIVEKSNGELEENDVIVDRLTLNYGKKRENPIDYVKFFDKKEDENKVFSLDSSQVSYLVPLQFEEVYIRIFTRDSTKIVKVRECFKKLLKDYVPKPKTYYTKEYDN